VSLRTPLGEVRGLGSAKEGTHHWWHQRLTAIALIPLGIWFVISLIVFTGASHAEVAGWMAKPLNAGLLLLLIGATFYHLKLGVQVVIEDYVSTEWQKLTAIIVVTFGCIALALASAIAVILVMVSN
jgi:succinate dehydrogenase / fumarate reductase membrane anchor subunit